MPNEDKANILKNISDLQQTIQAFYNKDKKKSALTILKNKLDTLADTEGLKDDLLQDAPASANKNGGSSQKNKKKKKNKNK